MNTLMSVSYRKWVKEFLKRFHSSSPSTFSKHKIVIPNRIERGPTDILRALEKTIYNDPTSAHYKYHDDPYLIPKNKQEQRMHSLAKESGKKTAMWICKEHADLFQHKVADPIIPAFVPPVICKEKSQASEELLINAISTSSVSEALNIYKLLDENVSIKTKQSLLELLCYSNCNDLPQKELMEQRWFQRKSEPIKNSWSNAPEIDKLFNYLISQDTKTASAAYNALICGTAKYMNVDKTWSLYTKCVEMKIPLSIEAYNAVISIISFLSKGEDKPREMLINIFKIMAANGVHPNVKTLNAAITVSISINDHETLMDLVSSLFAEFKQLGIKPSLAFYYHFLTALSENTAVTSKMVEFYLTEILNIIEKEKFTLQDPKDTYFFASAMFLAEQICAANIGKRLHDLLLRDDNYQFLCDSYKEAIYYRNYINLCLTTWSIESFLKMYFQIVPNIYVPEPSTMKTILDNFKVQPVEIVRENLPKLLKQINTFGMFDRDNVIEAALNLATNYCGLECNSPMHNQFGLFAFDLWKHKQNQIKRRIQHQPLSAKVWGYIAVLLTRAGMFDEAFDVLDSNIHNGYMTGKFDLEQLDELFRLSVLYGDTSLALLLVEYAVNNGFDHAVVMGEQISKTLPLTESEKSKLQSLFKANELELTKEDNLVK